MLGRVIGSCPDTVVCRVEVEVRVERITGYFLIGSGADTAGESTRTVSESPVYGRRECRRVALGESALSAVKEIASSVPPETLHEG